ncbi:MAG TPA: substrate-binding domain-containing protein, partial [Candidatus Methylacidiphilales bacterium]|nr:substrate-binding domain-containing protein [Candidatus Methylacidiphilales bacterium]
VAILEAGIKVPDELKLVLHRNADIEFLNPLPVSWIEANPTEVAAALVEQVHRQLRGEKIEPIFLEHHLVPVNAAKP